MIRQQMDGVLAVNGDPAQSPELLRAKIAWGAQAERAKAYHDMAALLKMGSKARVKALKEAEEELLKADRLRKEYKVACMPEGKEKEREAATIVRHGRYDQLKSIFRTPTEYSREESEITIKSENGQELRLINEGRATMGGTKAMYRFRDLDRNGELGGQSWLFKEATNCIGMAKPEGAVVTEEASRLQQELRGALSIPAYCIRDEKGKVIGSIQKELKKVEGGTDLFKWQAQKDLAVDAPEQETLNDLMSEHTLDWVLCNFDTKGENFINQAGGHVVSFDKEASLNKLFDPEAQAMSYTYKPHANDTIYNTMFKAYVEGKVRLDLNANFKTIQYIEEKQEQDPDYFVKMFKNTLDTKYGTKGEDRDKAEQLLRERFQDLRETYRAFYTQLIDGRMSKFQGDSEDDLWELEMLSRLQDKHGRYRFPDENNNGVRE
ncbi:hypothetical protein [Pseudoflavonifractor sp. MSJ-37]|uniref:hypothetical protein n=1 Tax=Pseudoflavonifractor sp. MSJ-37 TaxID=2841531 RepID=UPI001C10B6F5|nr:hypothetical protein [Pseudoflavonifractor sp. MSJ-37]MBU5435501.1 hypothetical protein [Pseudoflavonifractor sp. MSJ-37]